MDTLNNCSNGGHEDPCDDDIGLLHLRRKLAQDGFITLTSSQPSLASIESSSTTFFRLPGFQCGPSSSHPSPPSTFNASCDIPPRFVMFSEEAGMPSPPCSFHLTPISDIVSHLPIFDAKSLRSTPVQWFDETAQPTNNCASLLISSNLGRVPRTKTQLSTDHLPEKEAAQFWKAYHTFEEYLLDESRLRRNAVDLAAGWTGIIIDNYRFAISFKSVTPTLSAFAFTFSNSPELDGALFAAAEHEIFDAPPKNMLELHKWPVLDKATIMKHCNENFDHLLYARGGLYFGASGGTSGKSRLFIISQNAIPAMLHEINKQNELFRDLLLDTNAVPHNAVAINFFVAGFGGRSLEWLTTILAGCEVTHFPLETRTPDASIHFVAERYGASIVTAMTSRLLQFAIYCARHKLKLPTVTRVLHGGEHFDDVHFAICRRVFSDEVQTFGMYGSSEAGVFAVRRPIDQAYEARRDCVIVEVLDENGNEVPEGGEGRLVVTNVVRRGFPQVRFDTGDWARAVAPGRNGFECLGRAPGSLQCCIRGLQVTSDEVHDCLGAYLTRVFEGACLYQVVVDDGEDSGRKTRVSLAAYVVPFEKETMVEIEEECVRRMVAMLVEIKDDVQVEVCWVDDEGLVRVPGAHKLALFVYV